ncbi:S9 family peptidase [bacterium]|nr:S9 family peptidase [bacterium]
MRSRIRLEAVFTTLLLLLVATGAAVGDDAPARSHTIVPADYFTITSVGAVAVSPDGGRIAYVETRWLPGNEGKSRELWTVDRKGGAPLRLTFGDFGAGHPTWSPDGAWLYFLGRDEAGRDAPPHDGSRQVWRIRPDGSGLQAVTASARAIGTYALGPDGNTLYTTTSSPTTDEEWRDLRTKYDDLEYGHGVRRLHAVDRLDLTTWRTTEVLPADRVIWELTVSPDGGRLGLITTTDNELIFKEGWSRVEVVDLASGLTTPVTDAAWRAGHPSPYGWLDNLCWSGDGGALAFTIGFDGYPTGLWTAEFADEVWSLHEIARPDPIECAGGLAWRGGDRTLCYLAEAMGRVRVAAVEKVRGGAQGETRVLTAGDVVVGDYGFDARGRNLAAVWETTTAGNDVYAVEGADRFRALTHVNPQMDTWILPRIEHVSWTGADGETCHGILELPADYKRGDGPLPAVIELHGGPTSSTKFRFRLWMYGRALMAANGYALLSPNYHGSTGYGDAFLTKLVGRENEIEVADIALGTRWLIDEGLADPARIGVMGWSNGGYLTNCMIAAEPDLYAAASSGAGVLDMVIQWGTEDTPGHVINFVPGLPWEDPAHYRKASPLYDLHKVKTPTIIHVGGSDPRVPPAHSRALYRALKHYLDVPTELVVYPGEPHGLTTQRNRMAKMEWDLAWFRKYLLGE